MDIHLAPSNFHHRFCFEKPFLFWNFFTIDIFVPPYLNDTGRNTWALIGPCGGPLANGIPSTASPPITRKRVHSSAHNNAGCVLKCWRATGEKRVSRPLRMEPLFSARAPAALHLTWPCNAARGVCYSTILVLPVWQAQASPLLHGPPGGRWSNKADATAANIPRIPAPKRTLSCVVRSAVT